MNTGLFNSERFNETGYVTLKNIFEEQDIRNWENTLCTFYTMQALKFRKLRKHFKKGESPSSYMQLEDLITSIKLLEESDKRAAYQAMQMATQSAAAMRITSTPKLVSLCSDVLKTPKELLIFSPPTFFINYPNKKRLLTHWHTEASFYPKRRSFINLWIPIFTDKRKNNGTMFVLPGTHKQEVWHDTYYIGYDDESFNEADHIQQFEVPEEELANYKEEAVEADRGDLVLFARNLLHRSSANQTSTPSFATVIRAFDYRKDLTLNASIATTPRIDDYSRPGVAPLSNV